MKQLLLFLFTFIVLIIPVHAEVVSHGRWTKLADMPDDIQEMPCVAYEGAIYVPGGMVNSKYPPTKNFIRYIIAEDRWEKLPDLPVTLHHTAIAAMDGKIYIIGGINKHGDKIKIGGISDQLFEYDIEKKTWTKKAKLLHPVWATSACVYDGKIWIFSGTDGMTFKSGSGHGEETQVYDPETDSWSDKYAKMPRSRNHTSAVVIGDRVYISPGRWKGEWDFTDDHLSVYHFKQDRWEEKAKLPEFPRSGGGFARVGGYIYFLGGEGNGLACLNKVHAYDYRKDKWIRLADMPERKHGMWAAAVGNQVYVTGGAIRNGVEGSKKLFRFDVDVCKLLEPTKPQAGSVKIPELPEGEWVKLFDGETLNGWHQAGHGFWCVKDGMIIGTREGVKKGGFLFTDKDTYKNFEFIIEVKIDFGCDSGIHLRDVSKEDSRDSQSGDGYQCCLDYNPGYPFGGFYYKDPEETYKGSFLFWKKTWPYVIRDTDNIHMNGARREDIKTFIEPKDWKNVFNPNGWNQIRVRIEGQPPKYQCWINGVKTVELQTEQIRNRGYGKIGLQIINDPNWKEGGQIHFRNIYVRILP